MLTETRKIVKTLHNYGFVHKMKQYQRTIEFITYKDNTSYINTLTKFLSHCEIKAFYLLESSLQSIVDDMKKEIVSYTTK